MRSVLSFTAITALAIASPVAFGDFMAPSWGRTDPFTTYQQWETFASPAGPNPANLPPIVPAAPHNPNGAAGVSDSSGGSFVTGGGNIYSPTAVVSIDVQVPEYNAGDQYVTTVLFQTRTLGTEPVYGGAGGVRLTYVDVGGGHTIYPTSAGKLFSQSMGSGVGGGELVDYAAVFQVPFSSGSLLLEIEAADTSMSFDRATVDTIVTRASVASPLLAGMNPTIGYVPVAVPEPGCSLAVGGLACVAIGGRRRRCAR